MKVYRDKDNKVINIGEWDYQVIVLDDGEEIISNPLPNGATFKDEVVVSTVDGGLCASTDYETLRKLEYPPITEYLDGVVKNDKTQIQAYIDKCNAVKAKYPKPKG